MVKQEKPTEEWVVEYRFIWIENNAGEQKRNSPSFRIKLDLYFDDIGDENKTFKKSEQRSKTYK